MGNSRSSSRKGRKEPLSSSAGSFPARVRSKLPADEEDFEPLSAAQITELKQRVRDSRDPIRYMLVSEFSRRFILYYNVSNDVYAMNDPAGGTLFKRLKTAESVKKFLGKGTSIVKYTTKGGKLKRLSPYQGIWNKRRASKSRKDA